VKCFALWPSRKWILIGYEGAVSICCLESGRCITSFQAHNGDVTKIAVIDSSSFLTGGSDGLIVMRKVAAAEEYSLWDPPTEDDDNDVKIGFKNDKNGKGEESSDFKKGLCLAASGGSEEEMPGLLLTTMHHHDEDDEGKIGRDPPLALARSNSDSDLQDDDLSTAFSPAML